jgi:aconitate hydratase
MKTPQATSDSIASETITITKKRDKTRRARADALSRFDCSNSSSTMVWTASKLRVDTPIEADYYRAGGILPFVLRQLLAA